jgi:hypothetical protein
MMANIGGFKQYRGLDQTIKMGIECDLIEEKKLGTNRNWDLVNAHGKQCEIEATKKTQLQKQWWPEPTRGVPEIGVPPNHPFLETPTRIQALRPRRMRIEQIVVSSQPLANGLAPCAKISAKSWIPKVPSIGFSQFGAQFGVPLKVGNANDVTPCDAILNVVIHPSTSLPGQVGSPDFLGKTYR